MKAVVVQVIERQTGSSLLAQICRHSIGLEQIIPLRRRTG